MPRAAIGYDPHALAGARPEERHAVYRRLHEQGPIYVRHLDAWIVAAAVFPEPAVFDPARRNTSRHLGFGWGIHHCVGAPVARLESRIALEALAARLPNLRLAPTTAERERHPMLRGLEHLLVEWSTSDGRPDTDM